MSLSLQKVNKKHKTQKRKKNKNESSAEPVLCIVILFSLELPVELFPV